MLVGLRDTIESPGFPIASHLGVDCLWKIKIPKGFNIVLKFDVFSLRSIEGGNECADYVDVLEDKEGTKIKGRYCGTNSPGEIKFNSNEATIRLHTSKEDFQSLAVGFSASYRAEGKAAFLNCCLHSWGG